MSDFRFFILYVADVARSQAFYAHILGREAIEASPGFAMFEAAPGVKLGLWRADDVKPQANRPGGAELCVTVESDVEVDRFAARLSSKGVEIAQAPTRMDFGYTSVGVDPDGHRLRVFAQAA